MEGGEWLLLQYGCLKSYEALIEDNVCTGVANYLCVYICECVAVGLIMFRNWKSVDLQVTK